MGSAKPRNHLGELYVRLPLPRRVKKHTDRYIKDGRAAKGRETLSTMLNQAMWGRQKPGAKRR